MLHGNKKSKDCRILTVFFLCHSADVTSFACLLFYNKDRREQCGTLHRCSVFGQWHLFLSGSLDCRKAFVKKMPLVAAHFGRICSITVFLSAAGLWHKSRICAVCCHDDFGAGNCLFSQKLLWILSASSGIGRGFFSVGWFSVNAFCLYGCPTVSWERADHFCFHDALATAALGLSAVLHTSESRGRMAGTSWQKQGTVLQDNFGIWRKNSELHRLSGYRQ